VTTDEELEGDGHWHHWAFTAFEADPDVLAEADARAAWVAGVHGVRYDGWEVTRDRGTGAARRGD
jgi:hypothetical protein